MTGSSQIQPGPEQIKEQGSTAERLCVRIGRAAQILDVSESTVRRLIAAGELPVVQLPESMSTRLIRLRDLQDFVDSRCERVGQSS